MTLSARHALVHRWLSRRRARRPAAAARRRRPLGQAHPAECRCSWSSWCRNGGPLCGLRRHAAPRQNRDERLSHRTTVGIVTIGHPPRSRTTKYLAFVVPSRLSLPRSYTSHAAAISLRNSALSIHPCYGRAGLLVSKMQLSRESILNPLGTFLPHRNHIHFAMLGVARLDRKYPWLRRNVK